MIFFGTKTVLIKTERQFEKCLTCNNHNCVEVGVFQKYFHLYWIPFTALKKLWVSNCTHCGRKLDEEYFSLPMRNTRDMMKHAIKTPLWTFSGVILVLTFATYSIFKNRSNRDEYEGFILSPNVGDIYTIKTFQGNYTTYKVIKSTKDSVFVNQNQHETDKYSGLGRLRNKSTAEYDKKLISFSNQEIQRLYASDTLLSVQRSK